MKKIMVKLTVMAILILVVISTTGCVLIEKGTTRTVKTYSDSPIVEDTIEETKIVEKIIVEKRTYIDSEYESELAYNSREN